MRAFGWNPPVTRLKKKTECWMLFLSYFIYVFINIFMIIVLFMAHPWVLWAWPGSSAAGCSRWSQSDVATPELHAVDATLSPQPGSSLYILILESPVIMTTNLYCLLSSFKMIIGPVFSRFVPKAVWVFLHHSASPVIKSSNPRMGRSEPWQPHQQPHHCYWEFSS